MPKWDKKEENRLHLLAALDGITGVKQAFKPRTFTAWAARKKDTQVI